MRIPYENDEFHDMEIIKLIIWLYMVDSIFYIHQIQNLYYYLCTNYYYLVSSYYC